MGGERSHVESNPGVCRYRPTLFTSLGIYRAARVKTLITAIDPRAGASLTGCQISSCCGVPLILRFLFRTKTLIAYRHTVFCSERLYHLLKQKCQTCLSGIVLTCLTPAGLSGFFLPIKPSKWLTVWASATIIQQLLINLRSIIPIEQCEGRFCLISCTNFSKLHRNNGKGKPHYVCPPTPPPPGTHTHMELHMPQKSICSHQA